MSNAIECLNKMKWFREQTGLRCHAVIHHGCISNVHCVVGQGVCRVNDVFAFVYYK